MTELQQDRATQPPAGSSASPVQPIYLNRAQAADYISRRAGVRVTATILANRASLGTGPAYRVWNGRGSGHGGRGRYAVYRPTDLDAWIEDNLHNPADHKSDNDVGDVNAK